MALLQNLPLPNRLPSPSSICPQVGAAAPTLPSSFDIRDANITIKCGDKRHNFNERISNIHTLFELMSRNTSFADVATLPKLGYSVV